MLIKLDKLEMSSRINALRLTTHYTAEKHKCEIYYDTELAMFFVINEKQPASTNKYSGKIMIPPSSVSAAQVSEDSVPKFQPIGTKPENDTPSGKRKQRTLATSKSAIEEKIEQRTAAKPE